jgi:HlyD family secretion protein
MKPLKLVSGGLTPLILLSALVSGGAYMARVSAAKRLQAEQEKAQEVIATAPVVKGDFEVAVRTMGKLEAVKAVPVMSEVTGQVVRVIPNGTKVKKDDIIMELDAKRMARSLRDQQNQYADAAAKLEQRKRELAAGVKSAGLALAQAQKDLDQFEAQQEADLANRRKQRDYDAHDLDLTQERFARMKRQADASLIPKQQVELATADIRAKEFGLERQDKDIELAEAKANADRLNKQAAAQKAQADLERAKAAEQDETQNATNQLKINEQQLKRAREQFAKAVIRSPAVGIVALESAERRGGGGSRPISIGDPIYEGRKVATIPDLAQMQVALELTQDQVRLVKKKQKARIEVEGVAGTVFQGEVTEIAQTATEQRLEGFFAPTGERVFQTHVSLKNPKKIYLRPGTTAVIHIIVDRVPKALSIPLECVFTREGKSIVYVARDGGFVPVEVKLGPKNEDVAVVKKGLKAGDRVSLHDVREAETDEDTGGASGSSPLPF